MEITRKQFIKRFSSLGVVFGAGVFKPLKAFEIFDQQNQVKFRFIVASDAHYGQPDTPYHKMAHNFIAKANVFHKKLECDFCVLNGDIIHDDPTFMPTAKSEFEKLNMPIHAVQGNHDRLTHADWLKVWGKPVNYSFDIEQYTMILVTTSNETGEYLSPDLNWLKQELEKAKDRKVLMFVHIPQHPWTKHAIETPEFFEILNHTQNVKAVFHGHEHDQDGVYTKNKTPFIFDAHIGGSWGTSYKGFRVVEVLNNGEIVTYMMNPDIALDKVQF